MASLSPTEYNRLHQQLNREFPRAGQCEQCGAIGLTGYASIEHRYTRNRADYLELCPRCHKALDGISDETRAKISATLRGRKRSAATRAKMKAAAKARAPTHCPSGHPYDAQNTRITKRGARDCRTCDAERRRAIRAARTEEEIEAERAKDRERKHQENHRRKL